ncbi:MAG: hypothetical protein WCW30_05630 [Candidatus Gracilibacteria bacterium]
MNSQPSPPTSFQAKILEIYGDRVLLDCPKTAFQGPIEKGAKLNLSLSFDEPATSTSLPTQKPQDIQSTHRLLEELIR